MCRDFSPGSTWRRVFLLCARERGANRNAVVWMHVWNQRSDQEQHGFFTEHIVVFIRALSGSNTEKKWT